MRRERNSSWAPNPANAAGPRNTHVHCGCYALSSGGLGRVKTVMPGRACFNVHPAALALDSLPRFDGHNQRCTESIPIVTDSGAA